MDDIKSFREFYNDVLIKSEKKFALLAGNGLGLSNPNIGYLFRFDQCEIKRQLKKSFNEEYLFENFTGPEEMLGYFRHELIVLNSKFYIDNYKNNEAQIKDECRKLSEFIERFKSLYTLNYDSLIYYALIVLKNLGTREIFDGFKTTPWLDYIDKDTFDSNVKEAEKANKFGIFHLHGAFHIFRNSQNKVMKCSLKDIRKKYKVFHQQFRQGIGSDKMDIPLIIMADRSGFKESLIQSNFYYKTCFEKFKWEDQIFIFGCSFEKDDHVIESLLDHTALAKKIYISYFSPNSLDAIKSKVENRKGNNKVTYVNCGGDQVEVVQSVIWQHQKT